MSFDSGPYSSPVCRTLTSPKLLLQAALLLLLLSPLCTKQSLALTSTTTTLDVSGHSYAWSTPVTLTATVRTANGKAVTPGQVIFCKNGVTYCEDSAVLGKAQLKNDGTASIKLLLSIGKHDIYAKFRGTNLYAGSSSLPNVQTVDVTGKYSSAAVISASGSSGNYTLSSTVTALGADLPSGTLSFLDAANPSHVWKSLSLNPSAAVQDFSDKIEYVSALHHNPHDLGIGDLNNDGVPDLVLVNYEAPSSVTVLLGDASHPGRYLTGTTYIAGPAAPTTDSNPLTVALGDFNNDGFLDIAIGSSDIYSSSTPNKVSVMLNNPGNPGRSFQPYQEYTAGINIVTLTAEDFNGDGILDLLATTTGNLLGSPSIPMQANLLLGDPAHPGQFLPPMNSTISGHSMTGNNSTIVADFNHDGLPDFAVLEGFGGGDQVVHIMLNTASSPGTFQDTYQLSSLAYLAYNLISADFNHDGNPDLAISGIEHSNDTTPSLEVYLADSAHPGQFLPKTIYNLQGFATANIVTGDFNSDGWMDIAAQYFDQMELLFADPSNPGTFLPVTLRPSVSNSTGYLRAADLNGDGLVDIAAASAYPPNVHAGYNNGYADVYLAGQTQTLTASNVPIGTGSPYVEASYSGDTNYYGHNSCPIGLPQTGQSGPVVSGLTVSNVGKNSATISWTTDIGTNGQAFYGPTSSLGSSSPWVDAPSTTHSITLSGLTPGTTYYYVTQSIAFFNGCSHWTTFTPTATFTTLP